jgi:pimeloyl-ACP methyl ester carboxylesterase
MFLAGFDDHRKSVTTPAADVSYVDVGAGPPALFVHGLATNAYMWQNLIGHLSDVRRCIAVDLPLHGQSPARPQQQLTIGAFADVLHQICAGLDLPQVDLVAHDTGGDIAQVLAGRHPERLRTGLRALDVPTLIVWGTDDDFFALRWAYWLRDTIPGADEVVEIADGKLFFPHERAADLAPHIRRRWTAQ